MGWGLALTGLSALGTAAAVAPPVIDAATGNTGRSMRDQILSDGPDMDFVDGVEKPVFRTNWWQNQFIDEEKLLPQYYERERSRVKKDPEVAAVMRQLGPGSVTINDGDDVSDVTTRYAQQFKDSKVAEALDLDKKRRDAAFKDPTAVNQREIAAEATRENTRRYDAQTDRQAGIDRDRIAERKEGRLDRVDQRMSDREVRMMELGMQERMFDKRLQSDARADKKQRMAAIIAGLANLGGAFAI